MMLPKPDKLLQYFIIGLISILFILIPSVDFLPYYNPTVSGKFFTFLFGVEILAFLFFLRQLALRRYFTVSLVDILFIGLLVYIGLNRYIFQPFYSFSIRYYELLGLFAFYLILRSNKNEKIFYSVCVAAIIGANIQIVIGNLQLYDIVHSNSSFFKATGSFFNGGPYAGYLASVFPISLFFLKNNKTLNFEARSTKWVNGVVLLNIIGTFSIIPVLMSRACVICILFTVLIVYYKEVLSFCQNLLRKKVLKFLFYFTLVGCLVAGLFLLVSLKAESSKGRYLILKATGGMIADKPVVGFGFDRFRSEYMNYQAKYLKKQADSSEAIFADNTCYAFNEPLQFIVENGIVGLILLLPFVYFLIKKSDKENKLVHLSFIGLFTILIFSLFSYPFEILPIKIVAFLYISILASYYKGGYRMTVDFGKMPAGNIAISILLIFQVVLFYLIFIKTLRIEQAFAGWKRADLKFDKGDFTGGVLEFEKAYPELQKNGDFLIDYGKTLFYLKEYDKGIEVLKAARTYIDNTAIETSIGDYQYVMQDYKNAERSYIIASDMKPSSYSGRFLLFKLYEETSQTSKAIKTAQELLGMKIKVPSEAVDAIRNEAKFFLKQHQGDKSI